MRKLLCSLMLVLPFFSMMAKAETVSVHGSTVFMAAALDPHLKNIEKETGLKIAVEGNSAGQGVEDLVQGKTQVAMIAGQLEGLVDRINAKKPGTADFSKLRVHEVGITHIAFAVHPSNKVKELTRDQVIKILLGQIKNWKEVGGSDSDINVVTGVPSTGLRSAVEKEILGGKPISDDARALANTRMIGLYVEKFPNSIGIFTRDMLSASMREVKLDKEPDPITLSYVTLGEPTSPMKQLIDATIKFYGKKE